jgi:ribosomal protein S18 acetylase RimI-like enzyme
MPDINKDHSVQQFEGSQPLLNTPFPSVIVPFEESDIESIVSLWAACDITRAWNDPYKDIARKLTVQPELFLVVRDGRLVIATIMGGFDGHRGWINYLAVAESHRGQGLARRLMAEVEQRMQAMGCPKMNLMVRQGNDATIAFYEHLGYSVEKAITFGKRLISDE